MEKNGAKFLSMAAYARHRGCDRSYVTRLVQRGVLPLLPDRRLDRDVCDSIMATEIRPRHVSQPSRSRTQARRDYIEAQTQHEFYRGQVQKLKFELMAGELVSGDKILEVATGMFASCRTRVGRIPKAYACQLCGQSVEIIEEILSKAFLDALRVLDIDAFASSVRSDAFAVKDDPNTSTRVH